MSELCRHCQERIKLCNCGANNGREHWSSLGVWRASRYCAGSATQLHEPATSDTTQETKP